MDSIILDEIKELKEKIEYYDSLIYRLNNLETVYISGRSILQDLKICFKYYPGETHTISIDAYNRNEPHIKQLLDSIKNCYQVEKEKLEEEYNKLTQGKTF